MHATHLHSTASSTSRSVGPAIVAIFVAAMGLHVSPSNNAEGAVVGYWRFEEASGQALDSADDRHGTLLGGATRSTDIFGTPVLQTGDPNTQSMSFDGANGSAINMGAVVDVGISDFTLEAFVKVDSNGAVNFPLIAGKLVSGNFLDRGWELQARPDAANGGGEASPGKWRTLFRARGAGSPGNDLFSADLEFDQWYHLAGVRDGSTLRLFVDGIEVDSDTIPVGGGDFTSGQDFSVGGANTGGGVYGRALDGFVDEVRLSDEALDATQFLNAIPEPSAALSLLILGGASTLTRRGGGRRR